ncbi:MAG: hypothetical protein NTX49_04095 [Chlamydiae bacterium]|nr:hypothetical protein [Chlamydiota bacterium]
MVQKTSIQDLFDLPASIVQSALIQPSVVSVTSSFIKNLALAVIGSEAKLSKRCMERLYELIRQNNEANTAAHIQRINKLAQKACGATLSNNI